jgi:putative ABC transport system ATP-binding protein
MVTHDARYADFAQRKICMFDGRVVDEDTLHRLRREEEQRLDAQILRARTGTAG